MSVYLLSEEQFKKLDAMQKEMHGGTDRERDYAHKLWLLVVEVEDMVVSEKQVIPSGDCYVVAAGEKHGTVEFISPNDPCPKCEERDRQWRQAVAKEFDSCREQRKEDDQKRLRSYS